MSDQNSALIEKYRGDFLKEVDDNVEEGEWVKMCMQCGVCAGSCPLDPHWEYPPRELFQLIRDNKRDEVLGSPSMWMCTSCYNCVARCPREMPITHIVHGLAHYAKRLGLAPKEQPTLKFAQLFWDNLVTTGRINELKLSLSLYFMNGLAKGVKTSLRMRSAGRSMLKAKRLSPAEYFRGRSVDDVKGLHAMLKKAEELENARMGVENDNGGEDESG